MSHTRNRVLVVVAMLALFGLAAGGFGRVAAQEKMGKGFPAHVHTGTCDNLDPNPKYPLEHVHHGVIAHLGEDTDRVVDAVRHEADRAKSDAEKAFEDMKREEERLRREHPDVIPVHVSETVVDVPLADLLSSPHAINVHQSDENIDTYIACGNIAGTPDGDELSVVLHQESDSGYSGIAWLRQEKNKTVISIFLTLGLNAEEAGTPTP